MADTVVKLRIADTIIQLQSEFGLHQPNNEKQVDQHPERFNNFLYTGEDKPDIVIDINIVDSLPQSRGAKDIFITRHPDDNQENWRWQKKGSVYIYRSPLENKEQTMLVNKNFDRVTAYLLPKENKARVWKTTDIIYDFLQVLLINYFALNKKGVFVHGIGVKELDGLGLLFAGKSGAGKSTTARLWYKYSKAMVLNDDRIIVRKLNNKFLIYGAPWHGDFDDYLDSRIESAPLAKLFFIYHASSNITQSISQKEAFILLYPALFPAFWDKGCLENLASFCQDLVTQVPCFKLGFLHNEEVIEFVRKI